LQTKVCKRERRLVWRTGKCAVTDTREKRLIGSVLQSLLAKDVKAPIGRIDGMRGLFLIYYRKEEFENAI
jgi:hypothetical protein